MSDYELRFELSGREARRFMRFLLLRSGFWLIIPAGCAAGILLLLVERDPALAVLPAFLSGWLPQAMGLLPVLLVPLVMAFPGPSRRTMRKPRERGRLLAPGSVRVVVGQDGLSWEWEDAPAGCLRWDGIYAVDVRADGVYLRFASDSGPGGFAVPHRAFASDETRGDFVARARGGIRPWSIYRWLDRAFWSPVNGWRRGG